MQDVAPLAETLTIQVVAKAPTCLVLVARRRLIDSSLHRRRAVSQILLMNFLFGRLQFGWVVEIVS